ncbi:outer membrane beta-barrel protein [Vibrio penaeicida]|uniref:outer membrane beta-barrel protein n=1 Tax=Vibrio penaeicida TaxID=104609 RepID=UPI0027351C14|nr:outer membrane beta-barrel protein [Vibrio penaeicida]MDP2571178.1 outer membrane beta-barrel protein [Vibrio penaeicida]
MKLRKIVYGFAFVGGVVGASSAIAQSANSTQSVSPAEPQPKMSVSAGIGMVNSPNTWEGLGDRLIIEHIETSRTGKSLWFGYQWHTNMRIELGYVDFGSISVNGRVADVTAFEDRASGSLPVSAHSGVLAFKPSYGVTDSINLYGRTGVSYWQSEYSISPSAQYNSRDSGIDLHVGAGIGVELSDAVELEVFWDRGYFSNTHADMASLAFTLKF